MDEAKLKVLTKCKTDLIYFGKTITPKVFYLPTPKFHYEVADLLMNRKKTQISVQAPRGFAKSSLSVPFILHHITHDPGNKVIVIQSKTQDEAKNRLTQIKNIFDYSIPFKSLYGYAGKEVATTWTDKKIRTKLVRDGKAVCSITIKAIGTGMPARGMMESDEQLDNWRITLYFLDDADDEDNTLTPEQMEKNWDKFAGSKEGLDKRNGRVLVLGTFVRDGCIIDRLDGAVGWDSVRYEARWDDEDGHHLLWEEMRDDKWLDNKLAEFADQGTPWKYWAEYHNKNTNDKDRLFRGWKYWDGDLVFDGEYAYLKITKLGSNENEMVELNPPKMVAVNNFVGIDPASSEKQTADESVTFPISYSNDFDIYTHKYYNRKVNPMAHAEQIVEAIKQYKFRYGSVETTAYQEMLRQYLRSRMKQENLSLPGLELKWQERTEKSRRLEALEPFISSGHTYIKVGSSQLVGQLEAYPRNKKSPNLLDGFYFATRRLITPSHMTENYNYKPLLSDDEIIKQYRQMLEVANGGKAKDLDDNLPQQTHRGWVAA